MRRRIVGFDCDDAGDWVASLDCHHRRHVRHRPPFLVAPWVEDARERDRRIGRELDCALCDRCEVPDGLVVLRTETWDDRTGREALPPSDQAPSATWRRLRVTRGSVRFVARTDPPTDVVVASGGSQGIPPGVDHHVEALGQSSLLLELLGAPE